MSSGEILLWVHHQHTQTVCFGTRACLVSVTLYLLSPSGQHVQSGMTFWENSIVFSVSFPCWGNNVVFSVTRPLRVANIIFIIRWPCWANNIVLTTTWPWWVDNNITIMCEHHIHYSMAMMDGQLHIPYNMT